MNAEPAPHASITLDGSTGLTQRIRARTHEMSVDEPTDRGGADEGPAPYELLLGALASCTAIALRLYAERKEWDLGEIHMTLSFYRRGEAEHVERRIQLGASLSQKQRDLLMEVCERTPVTKTLKSSVSITTTLLSA